MLIEFVNQLTLHGMNNVKLPYMFRLKWVVLRENQAHGEAILWENQAQKILRAWFSLMMDYVNRNM